MLPSSVKYVFKGFQGWREQTGLMVLPSLVGDINPGVTCNVSYGIEDQSGPHTSLPKQST